MNYFVAGENLKCVCFFKYIESSCRRTCDVQKILL